MHPNGQIPAYEWNFSDVNPPVHAWAAWRVYKIDKRIRGEGDTPVSRARLPEAPAELQLVGEPEGRGGQQRLPGRVPRSRQHRGLRPLGALADRRPPRAVRRHRVDGIVLSEHARDGARAGPRQPGLRGHGQQVLRALHVHRRRHGPHGRGGRAHRPLGRGGRLLLRRAPYRRRRPAHAGPVTGRPRAPLLRAGDRARGPRAAAPVRAAHAVVPRQPRGPAPSRDEPGATRWHGAAAALAREWRAAPAGAPLHAGRGRVSLAPRHPRPIPVSRGAALRAPRRRHGAPGGLRARRVLDQPLRRQLELARARSGFR